MEQTDTNVASQVVQAVGAKATDTGRIARQLANESVDLVVQYAFSVVGAIAILIVGFILAGLLSRWTRLGLLKSRHVDLTLAAFLSNIIKYAIWILVIIMVLGQFGVQTTSVIAVLGAAGLAIGLALQGTLANIASGIMLMVLRPFRVGEYIEAGSIRGTVQEIGLFTTELKLPNGLFVMAPNSAIWSEPIVNFSRNPLRRIEFVVGIGYGDDMKEAREQLLALADRDERILSDPPPITFVSSLEDSSVNVGLWCWVKAPDYVHVLRDMTQGAKSTFDEVGISIPFPQREITQYVMDGRTETTTKK